MTTMLRVSCFVVLMMAAAYAQEEPCSVPMYMSTELPSIDNLPANGSQLIWTLTSAAGSIQVDNVTGDALLTLNGTAGTTLFVTQSYGILPVTVGSLPTVSFVEDFPEMFPDGVNAQVQGEVSDADPDASPDTVTAQSAGTGFTTVVALLTDPQIDDDGQLTFILTSAVDLGTRVAPSGKGCLDVKPMEMEGVSVAFNVFGYNTF